MNEVTAWGTMEDTFPKDARQLNGSIEVREVHGLYGLSNAAATHNAGLTNFPNRRPFVLSRSFFAGSQKFAWHWSGDNMPWYSHLLNGLDQLLTSNLAGVPFTGSDLGGMNADTSAELLARWYQLGAFLFPFYREHSSLGTQPREPYVYRDSHPAQYAAMLSAVVDRYRMLPVLYTAARDACESGQPFVAPVWYYFPQSTIDPIVASRQPILSGKIMVVPQLLENCMNLSVLKPPGSWFALRTGANLTDGQTVGTDWADPIPAFLRGGVIVALFNGSPRTVAEAFRGNVTLYAALEDGSASGSLYFDDLVSMEHENGTFVRAFINCTYRALTVRIAGTYRTAPTVERVVIYGAARRPEFVIPGGNVTFLDGVVDIQNVAFGLAEDHDFVAPTATLVPTNPPLTQSPVPSRTRSAIPTPEKTVSATPSLTQSPVPSRTRSAIPTPGKTVSTTPSLTQSPVSIQTRSASTISPSQPSHSPQPPAGLSTGAVVGIAVSCSVVAICVIVLAVCCISRRVKGAEKLAYESLIPESIH
jgi:alpha 1,3-glucosidase